MASHQTIVGWLIRSKFLVINLIIILAVDVYLLGIILNVITPTSDIARTAPLLHIIAWFCFTLSLFSRLDVISSWLNAHAAKHCRLLLQNRGLLITKVFVFFLILALFAFAQYPVFRELRPKPDRSLPLDFHADDSNEENGKASGIIRIR